LALHLHRFLRVLNGVLQFTPLLFSLNPVALGFVQTGPHRSQFALALLPIPRSLGRLAFQGDNAFFLGCPRLQGLPLAGAQFASLLAQLAQPLLALKAHLLQQLLAFSLSLGILFRHHGLGFFPALLFSLRHLHRLLNVPLTRRPFGSLIKHHQKHDQRPHGAQKHREERKGRDS
jgi:hypothetical protein